MKAIWERIVGGKVTTGISLASIIGAACAIFGWDVSADVAGAIALVINTAVGMLAHD